MADTTDLQRLVVSLEARLDQYNRAMRKAESDTVAWGGRLSGHFTSLERQLSGFGRSLIGGFLGLAGIRAFGEAIDKIANIGEIAGRIGISTQALQAMHEMALKTGASIEQIDKGLQSIAEQSAQKGSFLDKLFQANKLQISSTDTEANLRHLMDLLKNAQSESQRLFIATQVFGDKVGRQVVEAFSKGGPAIDAMTTELISKQKEITTAQIEEANKIRQAYREMASDVETSWDQMALAIVASMERASKDLKSIPIIGNLLGQSGNIVQSLQGGNWLKAFFGDFADFMRITPEGKLHIGPPEIATPTRGGSFVDRVVGAESGGVATAKNPLSTATGLGQFIESTWIDQFKKVFPAQASTMSREAILAMRTDAETSRRLIENYAKENAEVLQKAGVSVNDAALYLAHFLGPTGAINVLKAPGGAPLSGLLSPKVVAANPTVLGGDKTVADLMAYVGAKFPSAGIHPAPLPLAPAGGLPAGSAGTTQNVPTTEELKKLTDQLDVARDAVKGFFSDLISGLREGASLTETLGRAFDNLASKAIDNVLNQLVNMLLGTAGTPQGGILGGIFNFGNQTPSLPGSGPGSAVPALANSGYVPQAVAGNAMGRQAIDLNIRAHPTPYLFLETDTRAARIAGRGDARTLDTARRSFPGTATTFQKLGTTSR